MNSLKSTVTILFLLFVSYGVYRVIHTPDPTGVADGQFLVGGSAAPGSPATSDPSPASTDTSVAVDSSDRVTSEEKPLQLIKPSEPPPLGGGLAGLQSAPNAPPLQPLATAESSSLPPPSRSAQALLSPGNTESNNALIPTQTTQTPTNIVRASSTDSDSPRNATAFAPSSGAANTGGGPLSGPLTAVAKSETNAAPPTATGLSTQPSPSALSPAAALDPLAWESAKQTAVAKAQRGDLAQALRDLSVWYHAQLPPAERTELLRWLDALASRVVYSTEDWFAPAPYIVQSGETLPSIAARWRVPTQLVANINRSRMPSSGELVAGLELKSIPGPFRCEIDPTDAQLTLFLGDHYAGRFPIIAFNAGQTPSGQYSVVGKITDEAGEVSFLELDGGLTITGQANALPNSIVLSDSDGRDVFGILTDMSQVTILR